MFCLFSKGGGGEYPSPMIFNIIYIKFLAPVNRFSIPIINVTFRNDNLTF